MQIIFNLENSKKFLLQKINQFPKLLQLKYLEIDQIFKIVQFTISTNFQNLTICKFKKNNLYLKNFHLGCCTSFSSTLDSSLNNPRRSHTTKSQLIRNQSIIISATIFFVALSKVL